MDKLIVQNINDLAKFIPPDKKIGVWTIGSLIHTGHLKVLETLKTKADFIIGIYLSNFYQVIEHVTGLNIGEDKQFSYKSLVRMSSMVDITHLAGCDHLPYEKHTPFCRNEKELPTESLPDFIKKDDRTMALLRTSQSIVRKTQEVTCYTIHAGSIKDPWRPYGAWWAEKYLNMDYTILDPERDEFGNSYSSSFITWQCKTGQKIDFQILQPWMRSSFEVEYCLKEKGIEGLEVISFFYDKNTNYIFTKIKFDNMFWSECQKTE
jgi:hypothetical protein